MWFEAHIEVENDFLETHTFNLLQDFSNVTGRPDQHRMFCQVLRANILQSLNHIDEVSITGGSGFGIARERGNDTFFVVPDLPRTSRGFLLLVVGEMREVAAHQTR